MSENDPILSALRKHFPNNEIAPPHFAELLNEYVASGLSAPNLVREIESGEEHKLWAGVWEAMLYRHLQAGGHKLRNAKTANGQNGPDFGIEMDDKVAWIEAVVPEPKGLSQEWLAPPTKEVRVKSLPDTERLLRCTSVLRDKQKKFQKYVDDGVVGSADCQIIAVNICRLSDYDLDGCGISQRPLILEAVHGIGPIGIPLTRDGEQAGPAAHTSRFSVPKANGAEVPCTFFHEPEFKHISAVLQGHQKDMHEKTLHLALAHNISPTNALPPRLLKSASEYVAEQDGDGYLLKDIAT